jgi:hypothetical protein
MSGIIPDVSEADLRKAIAWGLRQTPLHRAPSPFAAARPLDVGVRDAFLQDVASVLASCAEVSPGLVHRIVLHKIMRGTGADY